MTSLVETYRDADRDEVSAITVLTAVHLDLAHRRASPLPEEVRARARDMTVDFALPWAASSTGERNVE